MVVYQRLLSHGLAILIRQHTQRTLLCRGVDTQHCILASDVVHRLMALSTLNILEQAAILLELLQASCSAIKCSLEGQGIRE